MQKRTVKPLRTLRIFRDERLSLARGASGPVINPFGQEVAETTEDQTIGAVIDPFG
jgi:hypothetical protein